MKFPKWITWFLATARGGLSTLAVPVLTLLLLSACTTTPRIDTSHTAASQGSRVLFIVLHFTSTEFNESLATLTRGDVSSHYLIRDDPPTIYRLVDENRRAFHAGESAWETSSQLNSASIGIELVNTGYRDTPEGRVWFDYKPRQIDALIVLLRQLVQKHNVRADRILGHSDVAPQRKLDPGPRFPWKRLADAGLIPWPDERAVALQLAQFENGVPDVTWFQERLAKHGFTVARSGRLDQETRNVIAAFQMKYRPSRFDGEPDAQTAALLEVLTAGR
jgi:N-acetylmuramoyl-L-alanine amidase